jgi:tRNA U34 5-carboxymethylaminomethyl modifying GTPase MnmE/TrmE
MMKAPAKHFLIIGRANAGKTLFILNFAQYMGYDNITIKFKSIFDEVINSNSIDYYKKSIVSNIPNTTRNLQIININIPVFKSNKLTEFIDSAGISSNIHVEQDVRDGMVQTLTFLKGNYFIIHIIDSVSVAYDKKIDDVDMELYKYGHKRGNYMVLINKIDLKESIEGIQLLNSIIKDVKVINISALHKTGFKEVKGYVSKFI